VGAVTLGKVAERAGVAVDTARKVLRDDPSVRFYLRERVLKAVRELDYQPNLVARALRDKRLRLVPISVMELSQPYFGGLATSLSRGLVGIGMEPALCFNPAHLLRMSRSFSTSASILATGFDEATIRALARRQKVVTIDSSLPPIANVGDVGIDFAPAYRAVFRKLGELGRRRIALSSSFFHESRARGWRDAKFATALALLREGGMRLAGPARQDVFPSAHAFGEWLDEHPGGAEAVLCQNDIEAAHVIGEMAARGLRTPDDILVVGCDANCLLRGMWSVKLDTAWIADAAIRLLRRLLEGESRLQPLVHVPAAVDDTGAELVAESTVPPRACGEAFTTPQTKEASQ
jgi:DNA-binding LacI/PurR family transcriptional regulator